VRAFLRPDDAAVAAARAELKALPNARLLVAIGRLSREKGHADLMNAFAQLCETYPEPLHLAIVGEGVARGELEQQRAQMGLEERVSLVGLKSDVRPYYAMADVFVLPSHSEGSPNVLLEAMAAGCASVATRVGGVPETVTHEKTALVVPPCDPAAMAEAIRRLLDDPALCSRMGAEAKRVAESEFSPEHYTRSMIQMYQHVLAGTKP
jgi:glycosyltransferase involved in cell wall biosynthesis